MESKDEYLISNIQYLISAHTMLKTIKNVYQMPVAHGFIAGAGKMQVGGPLARDWEEFGEKDLPVYFEKAYSIFLRRLECLRYSEKPLSDKEERELRFMLDALIEGHHALNHSGRS